MYKPGEKRSEARLTTFFSPPPVRIDTVISNINGLPPPPQPTTVQRCCILLLLFSSQEAGRGEGVHCMRRGEGLMCQISRYGPVINNVALSPLRLSKVPLLSPPPL